MNPTPSLRPRLVPDEPLPPYSYVPGQYPHPHSHPAGHSHGKKSTIPPCPDPDHWEECRAYLVGLDLFNHGYYWEAHEAWESLWHACGRRGLAAQFFKGLIQLAAAGVKAREEKWPGFLGHAHRAGQLFQEVACHLPAPATLFMGLPIKDLHTWAVSLQALHLVIPSGPPPPLFPFILWPGQPPAAQLENEAMAVAKSG